MKKNKKQSKKMPEKEISEEEYDKIKNLVRQQDPSLNSETIKDIVQDVILALLERGQQLSDSDLSSLIKNEISKWKRKNPNFIPLEETMLTTQINAENDYEKQSEQDASFVTQVSLPLDSLPNLWYDVSRLQIYLSEEEKEIESRVTNGEVDPEELPFKYKVKKALYEQVRRIKENIHSPKLRTKEYDYEQEVKNYVKTLRENFLKKIPFTKLEKKYIENVTSNQEENPIIDYTEINFFKLFTKLKLSRLKWEKEKRKKNM